MIKLYGCSLLSGNIAVHLFLQETRVLYDLESLWTLGEDYDEKMTQVCSDEQDPFSLSVSDLMWVTEAEINSRQQTRAASTKDEIRTYRKKKPSSSSLYK